MKNKFNQKYKHKLFIFENYNKMLKHLSPLYYLQIIGDTGKGNRSINVGSCLNLSTHSVHLSECNAVTSQITTRYEALNDALMKQGSQLWRNGCQTGGRRLRPSFRGALAYHINHP